MLWQQKWKKKRSNQILVSKCLFENGCLCLVFAKYYTFKSYNNSVLSKNIVVSITARFRDNFRKNWRIYHHFIGTGLSVYTLLNVWKITIQFWRQRANSGVDDKSYRCLRISLFGVVSVINNLVFGFWVNIWWSIAINVHRIDRTQVWLSNAKSSLTNKSKHMPVSLKVEKRLSTLSS